MAWKLQRDACTGCGEHPALAEGRSEAWREREKSKGSTGITDHNNVITSFSSVTAHTQLLDSKEVLCRVVFYVSQHSVLLG